MCSTFDFGMDVWRAAGETLFCAWALLDVRAGAAATSCAIGMRHWETSADSELDNNMMTRRSLDQLLGRL